VPPKKRALAAVNRKQASAPRATRAQALAQGAKLFALVAQGYTVTEAGAELGLTPSRASVLWTEACARQLEDKDGMRQALVERELDTLRQVKKKMMKVMERDNDPAAARVVVAAVKEIAAIAGLNAELKVRISNQRVDDTVADLTALIENNEDQIPRLLEDGVLVIGTFPIEESEDETAAG
jgi:hypothetical protein